MPLDVDESELMGELAGLEDHWDAEGATEADALPDYLPTGAHAACAIAARTPRDAFAARAALQPALCQLRQRLMAWLWMSTACQLPRDPPCPRRNVCCSLVILSAHVAHTHTQRAMPRHTERISRRKPCLDH